MPKLTSQALEAWNNREDRVVLTSCNQSNQPNAIWIICVKLIDDEQFIIADNAMHKTLQSIKNGSMGTLLYIAPEREAYQIKGRLEYHAQGPVYDDMKAWLDPKFPGKGAVVLTIEEVYYGAEKVV